MTDVTNENTEQFSPAFLEKAQQTQAALGGMGKENAFAPKAVESSLFDKVEKQIQSQEANNSAGDKTEVDKVKTEVATGEKPAGTENGASGESEKTDKAQQKAETTAADQEITIDSPIIGKLKLGAEKEEEKIASLENFESVEKFVKDNGLDLKTFQQELPTLLKAKDELVKTTEENKKFEALLEGLPKEMFEAMVEFSHGRDWRTPILKGEAVNFEVPFEKHSSEKMVEKYFPDKISKEDWEEYKDEDGDTAVKDKVKAYLSLTQEKYSIDQSKFAIEKKTFEDNATKTLAVRQESFNKSRVGISEEFKTTGLNVDEKYVSQLDKNLTSDAAILAMFKNPDGTLKADAHKRAAMAIDGFGLVTQFHEATKKKIVTKEREALLQREGGTQAIKKSGDSAQTDIKDSEQKVKQRVADLLPTGKKQTF